MPNGVVTVPAVPVLQDPEYTGAWDMEPDAYGQTMVFHVDPASHVNTEFYKIQLVWKEASTLDGYVTFTDKFRTVFSRGTPNNIPVSELVAGELYRFAVSGVNDIGEGTPTELFAPFQVGHPMATIIHTAFYGGEAFNASSNATNTSAPAPERPPVPDGNVLPRWMESQVQVKCAPHINPLNTKPPQHSRTRQNPPSGQPMVQLTGRHTGPPWGDLRGDQWGRLLGDQLGDLPGDLRGNLRGGLRGVCHIGCHRDAPHRLPGRLDW